MNKKILAGLTAVGLLAAYALPFGTAPIITSAASSDYYLKIDGIEGESTDDKHKGEIDVMSWSWGVSQAGTMSHGGGGGAGKASFQDISITKFVDKATPLLFKACATGEHIKKIDLKVVRPSPDRDGEQQFMTYTFSDVVCTSWQNSADPLVEEVSFNYGKVEMEYKPQKADGTLDAPVKAGYDLKLNKKV